MGALNSDDSGLGAPEICGLCRPNGGIGSSGHALPLALAEAPRSVPLGGATEIAPVLLTSEPRDLCEIPE